MPVRECKRNHSTFVLLPRQPRDSYGRTNITIPFQAQAMRTNERRKPSGGRGTTKRTETRTEKSNRRTNERSKPQEFAERKKTEPRSGPYPDRRALVSTTLWTQKPCFASTACVDELPTHSPFSSRPTSASALPSLAISPWGRILFLISVIVVRIPQFSSRLIF